MKPKLVFLAVVSISYVGSAGCTLQNTSATSQLTEQKPVPMVSIQMIQKCWML
jgi:hypothetical protein